MFRLKIPKQAINGRLIVCDVTSIYANDCLNNSRKQLDSMTLILESLKKLKASDSFLLVGYPLLSQVIVGVFYVLVNMFLKIFIIYELEFLNYLFPFFQCNMYLILIFNFFQPVVIKPVEMGHAFVFCLKLNGKV
jgi:hypothetical protein